MEQTNGDRPSPSETRPGTRVVVRRPAGGLTETTDVADLEQLLAEPETLLWIDVVDPAPELVRSLCEALAIHPLIAEDINERNQRAKIETFDDVIHMVLFDLMYVGEVQAIEIDFVLTRRFLLTVHGPDWEPRSLHALQMGLEQIIERGTDHLLYALADAIVDGYFPVLDHLADDIDDLQDQVVSNASDWTLERLFALKRELIAVRRATSPAREIFNQLTNREVPAIDKLDVVYFRDVYDHLIRVTDELDNYRELVAGTLDIYLTIVNNNLSIIMKRLTGVTVLLAGIGAIAGIFGMSEATAAFTGQEGLGFWFVTGASVIGAATVAVVLRRIDWI